MSYFVLVYDPPAGRLLLGPEEFPESRRVDALVRRFELEREMKGYEVVVLGGESEDAIRRTHGRYFRTLEQLLDAAASHVGQATPPVPR